jgi:hypothetical protein
MLQNVKENAQKYGSGYSNWLQLLSNFVGEYYEIAISGKEALHQLKEIDQHYIPNKLIAGSVKKSMIPLLEDRFNENETLIYVCVNSTCQLPEKETKKALEQINIKF